MSYTERLLDPLWQKKRVVILQRDNFTCQYCGDKTQTLHIHHLCYNPNYLPWDVNDDALITICKDCHKIDHLENLSIMEKELINQLHSLKQAYGSSTDFKYIHNIIRNINKIILKNHMD